MLVLSRKENEKIFINKDISIVVVQIKGDKVRIGIEAPKHIPVHRQEVADAIAAGVPIHRLRDRLDHDEHVAREGDRCGQK